MTEGDLAAKETGARKVVAIFPWGNFIEDFLDPINVSLDAFCQDMTGGWLFGYIGAMQAAGASPILYCYSRAVANPEKRIHSPTGCPIRLLSGPPAYRSLARRMTNPYAASAREAFGGAVSGFGLALARLAYEAAPYLAISGNDLARSLAADGCTAILVQEYEDGRFDRIVATGRRIGIPVFATFQGGDRHFRRLERYTRPRAIAGCAGLVIASAAEAERVRRAYRPTCPIEDIPNPLDLDLWRPEPREDARRALGWLGAERIAIYHGRIDIQRKGLDALLSAWACVRKAMAGQPIRLVVVGDGHDREAFRNLVESAGSETVTWISGYTLDRGLMRRFLSAADVAVTASRHEGFPVAPLEAMACGLPLVASDAPGLPEILAGGRAAAGVLFRRDDVEALESALVELLSDPAKSLDYGSRARTSVAQRFALDPVGRRLVALMYGAQTECASPQAASRLLHSPGGDML
jgi:starch synthase